MSELDTTFIILVTFEIYVTPQWILISEFPRIFNDVFLLVLCFQ